MKTLIDLPDAFETVEIDLPEKLHAWFTREAASKNVSLSALLSHKATGITKSQLNSARKKGLACDYVLRWMVNQDHRIGTFTTPIVPAPFEAPVAVAQQKQTKPRRGPCVYWLPGRVDNLLFGVAVYWTAPGAWLDVTLGGRVLRFIAWGSDA